MVANKLQVPYGIDDWLGKNYKFHRNRWLIANELEILSELIFEYK